MTAYLLLPLAFFRFWYFNAPIALAEYFFSINTAFFHVFSLPLFLRTFFRPLKNEYRPGLVGFSVGMGIVVKSVLIIFDLLLFCLLLGMEILFVVSFLLLPIITIWFLFL
jgi:hypothetical protein